MSFTLTVHTVFISGVAAFVRAAITGIPLIVPIIVVLATTVTLRPQPYGSPDCMKFYKSQFMNYLEKISSQIPVIT